MRSCFVQENYYLWFVDKKNAFFLTYIMKMTTMTAINNNDNNYENDNNDHNNKS